MEDVFLYSAISSLRELNAEITPHNIYVILDLQGIANNISYEEIEAFLLRKEVGK
jgi:hypothetical protein